MAARRLDILIPLLVVALFALGASVLIFGIQAGGQARALSREAHAWRAELALQSAIELAAEAAVKRISARGGIEPPALAAELRADPVLYSGPLVVDGDSSAWVEAEMQSAAVWFTEEEPQGLPWHISVNLQARSTSSSANVYRPDLLPEEGPALARRSILLKVYDDHALVGLQDGEFPPELSSFGYLARLQLLAPVAPTPPVPEGRTLYLLWSAPVALIVMLLYSRLFRRRLPAGGTALRDHAERKLSGWDRASLLESQDPSRRT